MTAAWHFGHEEVAAAHRRHLSGRQDIGGVPTQHSHEMALQGTGKGGSQGRPLV